MNLLTPFERDVVLAFVAGDSPQALVLQNQVDGLSVRIRKSHGDAGFYMEFDVPPTAPRPDQVNLELTDVIATVEGMGPVQFRLLIEGGRLKFLEATSYAPWPNEPLIYSLRYFPERRAHPLLGDSHR
jgi:hypothetical protein